MCRILGIEETPAVVLCLEFCARSIGVVLHSLTSLCVALALKRFRGKGLNFHIHPG